jgi:hypothetical protein
VPRARPARLLQCTGERLGLKQKQKLLLPLRALPPAPLLPAPQKANSKWHRKDFRGWHPTPAQTTSSKQKTHKPQGYAMGTPCPPSVKDVTPFKSNTAEFRGFGNAMLRSLYHFSRRFRIRPPLPTYVCTPRAAEIRENLWIFANDSNFQNRETSNTSQHQPVCSAAPRRRPGVLLVLRCFSRFAIVLFCCSREYQWTFADFCRRGGCS